MNVKNLVLGIGIVIVFALVLWQGVETFYSTPQYNDFCNVTRPVEIYNVATCEAGGGMWTNDAYPSPAIDNKTVTGYCDVDYTCRGQYDNAMEKHSWVVFLVSLVAGVILLLVGLFIVIPEPVASALLGSAVWAIFWGSIMNWRNFGAGWRFLLLLLVLFLLIGLAIKFSKKK